MAAFSTIRIATVAGILPFLLHFAMLVSIRFISRVFCLHVLDLPPFVLDPSNVKLVWGFQFKMTFLTSALRFLVVLWLAVVHSAYASTVQCSNDTECETTLRHGSQCINGFCTNPFYYGGCLSSLIPEWNRTRICNSQDPPEAQQMGYCRPSAMGYTEIRMAGNNWESVNLVAWFLQVILSEILDVPTSIESGYYDNHLNFYQVNSSFDFPNACAHCPFYYDSARDPLAVANELKDCTSVTKNPDNYQPCYHLDPEYWDAANAPASGMEPFRELGVSVDNALFIPRFAAQEDPSLVSFMGLQGKENRRKLAETFKTPTYWKQFCEEVSPTNCTVPDPIAQRYPITDEEAYSYFEEGLYNGHFRHTEESNCDKYPSNCTGHFAGKPKTCSRSM